MTGLRVVDGQRGEGAQDVAYRWLKRHVAGLPRGEGTFLTEGEVAEATGTSRTPVREALLRMEAEGFLQIVPKKGAFVPPISDFEVEAVMEARLLVEDWCARRAVGLAESLSRELGRLLARQEELQGSPAELVECDRDFHRTIVRAAGNPVLADFYETLRDRQLRMGLRAIAASEQRARVVLEEHSAILEGVRSGAPDLTAAALAAHLAGTLEALQLPSVSRWMPAPAREMGGATS